MGRGRGRGRTRGRGASGDDSQGQRPGRGRAVTTDGGPQLSPAPGRQESATSRQPQQQQQQQLPKPRENGAGATAGPSYRPPASSSTAAPRTPAKPPTENGSHRGPTFPGKGISGGGAPGGPMGGSITRPGGGTPPQGGSMPPWGAQRTTRGQGSSSGVKTSPSKAQQYPRPPFVQNSSLASARKMDWEPISTDLEGAKKKGPTNYHGLQQPPNRPGIGTKGRRVMVRTNFFPITIPQLLPVYPYDVTITPQKLPKKFCRKVYEVFQEKYLGGLLGAYDGSKSSYYSKPIREASISKTFPPFPLVLEEGDRPREFTVKLQSVRPFTIDLQRIQEILLDTSESMPAIQALDVILRSLPSLRMVSIGRSFFSPPQHPTHLGGGKELWSGYYQSVRPTMGWKLMLNVDSAATAFYTEQTVFDFLCSTQRKCHPADSASPITDHDRQVFKGRELADWERRQFSREIKGLRIVITHLSYPRKYRVNDLTRLSARKQTFPLKDGTVCSVEDYFKENYPNSPIINPHLPCLHVGAKDRKVYLPIDVCKIVGGQKCMKKLTEIQTANMIKHTAAPAHKREANIRETVKRAQFDQDEIAKQFDIKVSGEMTKLSSRVLDPPKLNYRGSSVTPKDGAGAWDMRNGKRFYHGIDVKKWVVVVCAYDRCDCKAFVEGLVRQSGEMGMTMAPRPPIKYLGKESIESVFRRVMDVQKGLDLIVVIIDKGGSHYNEVKRLGDTSLGVATQCVLSNTVQKKCTPATLGNICLKINARLGGVNSVIDPDTLPYIVRHMPIIFFGADVTHPRSEDTTSPSIAAVVASIDLQGSKYRALHHNQKHRQEIIADLKEMVKEHLKEFKRCTGEKPVKIIFYRDGVSDGQFDAVRLEEIGALQRACYELERDYQPRITFIVVQKRHHTRFFPTSRSEADAVGRGKNVPPGTTVDTVITHPSQHDFYLCSHASIQGTSRPCHYHVIWDDSDFSADDLQLLTYQLCHMFWRCNRSVSYPAPTYYAHRDAAHARVLLQAFEENSSASGGSFAGSDDSSRISERNSAIQIHQNREKKMYFM